MNAYARGAVKRRLRPLRGGTVNVSVDINPNRVVKIIDEGKCDEVEAMVSTITPAV